MKDLIRRLTLAVSQMDTHQKRREQGQLIIDCLTCLKSMNTKETTEETTEEPETTWNTGPQAESETLDRLLIAKGIDPKTARFPTPPVNTGSWTPQDWCTYIVSHANK